MIVEVLSPSTESHDRGSKLFHYRGIPSLQSILLIARDRVHVEHYLRQANGSWLLTDFDEIGQVLELEPVGARLGLEEIYRRIPGL